MMTERLYFQSPYLREFTGDVLEVSRTDRGVEVILDRTAFFPTGGGQPHDTGSLGSYRVLDVYESAGRIIHLLEDYQGERSLRGRIDWERRLDHMQQHTGQHLLSAVLRNLFGWSTVSFHLGRETVTIDVDVSGLDEEAIRIAEWHANQVIVQNLPVETQFVGFDALEEQERQKLPQETEYVRLVKIPGIDRNPCKGTHVSFTGEIGTIKILHHEAYKGMTRISFVCGFRALKEFQRIHDVIRHASRLLKTNKEQFLERLEQWKKDHDEQIRRSRHLYQDRIYWEARSRLPEGRPAGPYRLHIHAWEERAFQEVKDLAKTIAEEPGRIVLYAVQKPRLQVVASCSQDVPLSMAALIEHLIAVFDGKGGGSRVFAQMTGSAEQWELYAEAAIRWIHAQAPGSAQA